MDGGALASPIGAAATAVAPTTPKGKVTVRVAFRPRGGARSSVVVRVRVRQRRAHARSARRARAADRRAAHVAQVVRGVAVGHGVMKGGR